MMGRVKLNPVLKGRCPVCHFEEFHLVSCQLGQSEAENARLQKRVEEAERALRVAHTETVEAINQTRSHNRRMEVLREERDGYKARDKLRGEALKAAISRFGIASWTVYARDTNPGTNRQEAKVALQMVAAIDALPEQAREKE